MNILIVKTGALGDVVRCTFLAQALKQKYQKYDPKIYWLTQKKAKTFFINNTYVFKVFDLESKAKLKKLFFNLILNLEEGTELCKFISNLKYDKIAGFIYADGNIVPSKTAKEWFDMSALGKKPQNDILKKKNKKTHRQIMSEIALVNSEKYEPFLRLTMNQRRLAEDFLRRHNLSRNDLIIGINTGSADRWKKSLSIEKTAELIDSLYRKFKSKILLFGGPDEIERNRKIMSLTKSPLIPTGCGNNLLEFPALISVCNFFITTDSLGLHIALALKRKTICLIGPTSSSEIHMYGLGQKIIAKSNCVCCYKKNCNSMDKINVSEIVNSVSKFLNPKISFLITAFKEPKIGKAIESALNQNTHYDYEIIVSTPDKKTEEIVKTYQKKNKMLKLFKDPGKGKSYALNLIFEKLDTDILILTDGDVFVSPNVVEDLSNLFLDPEIGCVTGRPVAVESMKTKYGYWAHFLFGAAHRIRQESYINHDFIECSGYLFAFRKKLIKKIPLDVAEDTIIPYYFWEKGYKIGYASQAKVFVKSAQNLEDWIKQKVRTGKSHETLNKYVDTKTTKRVKTFWNELIRIRWLLGHPKNFKEVFWAIQLAFARLNTWILIFKDTKILRKSYKDAWQRIESTK